MTDQSHLSRSARPQQGQMKTKWPTLGPDNSQDHLDPEREQDVPDEDDTQDIHRRHRGSSNDSDSQQEYQSSLPTAAEDPKTEFTLYDPTDGTQPLDDQTSLSPRSLGQGDAAGQMSQQSLIVQELENADEISQAGADGEPGDRGYGIHWGDVNPVPKTMSTSSSNKPSPNYPNLTSSVPPPRTLAHNSSTTFAHHSPFGLAPSPTTTRTAGFLAVVLPPADASLCWYRCLGRGAGARAAGAGASAAGAGASAAAAVVVAVAAAVVVVVQAEPLGGLPAEPILLLGAEAAAAVVHRGRTNHNRRRGGGRGRGGSASRRRGATGVGVAAAGGIAINGPGRVWKGVGKLAQRKVVERKSLGSGGFGTALASVGPTVVGLGDTVFGLDSALSNLTLAGKKHFVLLLQCPVARLESHVLGLELLGVGAKRLDAGLHVMKTSDQFVIARKGALVDCRRLQLFDDNVVEFAPTCGVDISPLCVGGLWALAVVDELLREIERRPLL
ncbi:hypothetical protein IWZ01DRAFT_477168 [Phyllosticta capitalensis]